ncbi:uncharacterized protein LOC123565055 [Mercenaria mercenaria]|uniref:uncharacterized protein LOC123565055 n=1 Tax=Mercenaria mercenaria TaxID=6596 RepID=UPI00234E9000|nr:uncharacterized protein LOC123565055 [Mercenaria mercenaria]XP_045214994.2 uncharacterized protein LOC123565055 [Mercenaria mercenaria]XP_053393612.1 uncharacterized protein LOC123565055 [Mercenaria mercenaria]
MGACYSKSGQDVNPDKDKRPRERKKGSQKNGHAGSFKNSRLVIDIPIQKDLSDTVYTEDSHVIVTDTTNCINKSQQTSLDHLTRDANKNIENLTGCEILEQNDLVVINDKSAKLKDEPSDSENAQKGFGEISKHLNTRDGKVSASDSGIEVETCKSCESAEQKKDAKDEYSEKFETHLNPLENQTDTATSSVNVTEQEIKRSSYICSNSKICDSQRHRNVTDHSNICSCHEGENRQSIASIDRLSESNKTNESTTDLDKIRLAIRQNSLGTPTEQRSFLDGSDISYDLPSTISQPEVTTMTMNGREVVVIDADLFSQIIDEIQNLKMKLSQLTEVIQDAEDEDVEGRTAAISILSSSA